MSLKKRNDTSDVISLHSVVARRNAMQLNATQGSTKGVRGRHRESFDVERPDGKKDKTASTD